MDRDTITNHYANKGGLIMKKLLDKVPWQIKFISLFVLVVGMMWLSWDLSR